MTGFRSSLGSLGGSDVVLFVGETSSSLATSGVTGAGATVFEGVSVVAIAPVALAAGESCLSFATFPAFALGLVAGCAELVGTVSAFVVFPEGLLCCFGASTFGVSTFVSSCLWSSTVAEVGWFD